MSKWFNDIFLPSLFDRAGANNPIWLTAKQTAVCTANMKKNDVRYHSQFGFESHSFFTAEWNGRKVRLDFSKLNGCGTIFFSLNESEQEEASKKAKEHNEQRRVERLRVMFTKHPQRFNEKLEKLQRELEEMKADNLEDINDGLITREEADKYEQEIIDDINFMLSVCN